jgi:multicomponent Na+:H+ antiporter subunit E
VSRLRHGAVFLAVYAKEFVVANAQVVREVVTPGSGVRPAVLRVPLRSRTDAEVATFVALVGLTPGTTVLEVERTGGAGGGAGGPAQRAELVVHAMDAPDLDAQRRDLQRLEGLLLAAWRGAA